MQIVGKEYGTKGLKRATQWACNTTTTKWGTEERTCKGERN